MPNKKTEKSQSYMERLRFDPRMMGSAVAKYISNIRLVILIAVTISLLGVMSYLSLPKRLNPEVKIPIVTVQTILPGAGPEDVESLVTIPLEDEVRGVKGVDTVSSFSQNNVSYITAQFFSTVDGEKAKVDVQTAIDSVTGLPSNATTPVVKVLDFEDTPIWTFAVTTDQQVPDLMSFTDELKNKIDDLPKIDRVVTSGFETQEIVITVTPEKVQEFGLNPLALSQSIQKGIASYPAGSITANDHQYSLTIDPSILTIDSHSKAENLGAAAWAESNKKMFVPQSCDSDVGDVAVTTDVASTIVTNAYRYTFMLYNGNDTKAFAGFGLLCGRYAACPIPGNETWALKSIAGVATDALPQAFINAATAASKRATVYVLQNSVAVTQSGVNGQMGSGEWADVVRGVDWLATSVQIRLFARMVNAPKVAYTDAGADSLAGTVEAVEREAVGYSILDSFTTPAGPKVATIDSTTRGQRSYGPITGSARLSGAIHKASVSLSVTP
jgi:hypothetical protein